MDALVSSKKTINILTMMLTAPREDCTSTQPQPCSFTHLPYISIFKPKQRVSQVIEDQQDSEESVALLFWKPHELIREEGEEVPQRKPNS